MRDSIALSILRYILAFILCSSIALLYWSSNLLEHRMQSLQSHLLQVQNSVESIKASLPIAHSASASEKSLKATDSEANLLTPDPFYEQTLPKLIGDHFIPKGVRRNATLGIPENLHPFSNWSQVSSWVRQCSVSVASQHFGIYETLAPDMALKLEQHFDPSGRPEYWVHLRDNVFWEPLDQTLFPKNIELAPHFLQRHQVTAEDFKFYFEAIMNPAVEQPGAVSLRSYFEDIEEFRVIDPLTFVVRWKTDLIEGEQKVKYIAKELTGSLMPLASWVYKYYPDGTKIVLEEEEDTYQTHSVWAQNFNNHWARHIIVSCGPWIFTGMTDRQITFRRNPNYYSPLAVLVEELEIQFKDNPEAIWQDFKAGKLDCYELRPDKLIEYERFIQSAEYREQERQGMAIEKIDYVSRSYTYIGWNAAKEWFKDRKVRKALTMAIDRQRVIKQNLNGMGVQITGPFYRYSKAYDPSISAWPYDPRKAKRLLYENGWYDSDADGVIDKTFNGHKIPFRFTLTYFIKNPNAKSIAEYISQALKQVDIACNLHGVDIADLSSAFDDKNFDAILLAWGQGTPPEEPKQLWYSKGAREKGSSNAISFINKEVDQIIDQLQYEYDAQKRIALYHRFDAIIHEEAPYTFLYCPKSAMLYRQYVQNVFVPAERRDLIPGADVAQPQSSIFWLKDSL